MDFAATFMFSLADAHGFNVRQCPIAHQLLNEPEQVDDIDYIEEWLASKSSSSGPSVLCLLIVQALLLLCLWQAF